MEEFLRFAAGILGCDVTEINMETARDEFPQWDSLMHLNLMMETEETYGVSIPIESAGRIKTLADLYEYVK